MCEGTQHDIQDTIAVDDPQVAELPCMHQLLHLFAHIDVIAGKVRRIYSTNTAGDAYNKRTVQSSPVHTIE